MKSIDQIESEPGIELKGTYDGVGIMKIGEKTFLTNLDENGQPFMLNGEPLLIDIEEGKNVATIINTGIINLVNNKGPHNEDLKIDSECATRFKIIVKNNKPLIVASSNGNEFLVLPIIVNKHLVLSNSDISHVVDRTLEQIETDVYVSEKNNDFAVGLNINDGKYYLYLKNENGYEKVDLTSINKENIFLESLDVPSKDTMSVIGDRIVAFDDEKKVFYEIVIPFDYINGSFGIGEYTVSATSNREIFGFTASRENPKEPNILDLNGTKLLLSDKNQTLDEKGNKFYTIIPGVKKSQKNMIYLDDFFEIEGVEFYRFGINDKKTFTDGKDVYKLECDTEGKVKLVNFEGKEYPYKISDSYNSYGLRNYTEVLDNSGGKRELIPAIKKTIVEVNEGKEESKEIYERLKLDDEQKNLNIVGISDEHGIVCLASDITNTSKFRFYRINPDNTLTYVFSNNYEIHFDKEKKSVEVKESFGDKGNLEGFYELVRKPNSSSILDPILIDGKEYYLVKTENGKTRYIKVNSNKNGFEFSIGEFEVDYKDLLPLQSQSFEFNSKTIYLIENGIVVIGEKKYQLCDTNGENTDNPENSITLVGNIRVLLLKIFNDSLGNIYGYAEGDEISEINNDDIRFSETDSINSHMYHCHSGIKKINIGGKECICLCYYREQNAISIAEDKEGKINGRYLYGKVSEGSEENKIIEGEEYECNGKPVCVTELLRDKYVKGEDGNIYYIKGQGKELKMLTLPDNTEIGNPIYCQPKNYYNPVYLKTSKGEAVKLKGQENLYYTHKETHKQKITINGVNYAIYTFFNTSANRLEQFKKVGEEYQPFGLGGTKNVLLIDNYLYIWLPHEKEPRQINSYNGIIQATTKYNEKIIFGNGDNNAKFRYGINGVSGDYIVYAVKKVGNNYFAVSCKEKGYKVSIDNNGDIKLDGIMYDEKKIEALYKIMTNDIGVPETVSGVTGEVEGIIK
ncbi:MAG: hypothetical protein WC850_06765 [Candidatus Gracilibacteria bacterium]